jgi:putative DNA primase/helicase
MRRQVPEEVQDPDLLAKLTMELPGLLVLAVDGLRSLMARGRFEITPTMRTAAEEYRAKTDTIVGFAQERLEFRPDARERTSAVYADYEQWCRSNGRHPLGQDRFRDHLIEVYRRRIEYKHRLHGYPTYSGVELRSEDSRGVAG